MMLQEINKQKLFVQSQIQYEIKMIKTMTNMLFQDFSYFQKHEKPIFIHADDRNIDINFLKWRAGMKGETMIQRRKQISLITENHQLKILMIDDQTIHFKIFGLVNLETYELTLTPQNLKETSLYSCFKVPLQVYQYLTINSKIRVVHDGNIQITIEDKEEIKKILIPTHNSKIYKNQFLMKEIQTLKNLMQKTQTEAKVEIEKLKLEQKLQQNQIIRHQNLLQKQKMSIIQHKNQSWTKQNDEKNQLISDLKKVPSNMIVAGSFLIDKDMPHFAQIYELNENKIIKKYPKGFLNGGWSCCERIVGFQIERKSIYTYRVKQIKSSGGFKPIIYGVGCHDTPEGYDTSKFDFFIGIASNDGKFRPREAGNSAQKQIKDGEVLEVIINLNIWTITFVKNNFAIATALIPIKMRHQNICPVIHMNETNDQIQFL